MKHLLIIIALLLSVSAHAKKEQPLNTLTKKEIKEGWKLLFNGKDLTGWKYFNGGPVTSWKVEEGIMKNSGVGSDSGGDIVTLDQFKNFELVLEWKIAPKSNSGIFYHVQEGISKAIYESGPEYQLIDDAGWPGKLKDSQASGANYDMNPPVGGKVKPIDEWNLTRIVVNGPRVEHWLNGVKVVEYELWSEDWKNRKEKSKWKEVKTYGIAPSGHIGLQDHGGLTMFRNIKIKPLP
jgi:hypothetical protein